MTKRKETKRYPKICVDCGFAYATLYRTKRTCPRCGGRLIKDEGNGPAFGSEADERETLRSQQFLHK